MIHSRESRASPATALIRPFKKNQTVVFDGDSSVNRRVGPGLTDWPYLRLMGWDQNWCDVVSEILFAWRADLALTMRNVGVGGSSTGQLLERFDSFVAPHEPDWIFVGVGGNDVRLNLTDAQTADNVARYIKRAEECGDCQVVYVGGFLPSPDTSPHRRQNNGARQRRYDVIAQAAAQNGGHFLDLGPGVQRQAEALHASWPEHLMHCSQQDTHYGRVGNLVIAGEFLKCLGYWNGQ